MDDPVNVNEVYVPIDWLGWRWPGVCARKGCDSTASHVLLSFQWMEHGTPRSQSRWCGDHLEGAAKRRRAPILLQRAELDGIRQAKWVRSRELYEAARRENKAREARILREHGRILRMSGYAGRLYHTVNDELVLEHTDGRQETMCCWPQGVHRVDNRVRGRRAPDRHALRCPRHPDGATEHDQ